jgi:dTDP-4-amino-4,6-dideoxygalactose transaminase
MLAHDLKAGDELITSPFSFVASANVALYVGAKPVFVDIEPDTYCMDPARVEAAITSKTKAIMPVDLYGHAAAIKELREIADRHRVLLIEDACQAHGATIGGIKAGAFGVSAAFSFYPTKNMTTSEGGMVTTDDGELAQRVRLLRQHGSIVRYRHEILGYNLRLTELAAAIGRAQLAKLDEFNQVRHRNAAVLTRGLAGIPGLTTPMERPGYGHVYHQYTVRVERNRDLVQQRLKEAGVGTAVHYPIPIHKQPLYVKMGYGSLSLPLAERASEQVLSLPVHPGLSESDLDRIVDSVRKVMATA